MSLIKCVEKTNERIKTMVEKGFNFRFASIDSYAYVEGKNVRVNIGLSLPAKIFMVFHEYNHLIDNNFEFSKEIKYSFSEEVEDADYKAIKDLKELNFDFDKLKGLFFFDKIFKDKDAKELMIKNEK